LSLSGPVAEELGVLWPGGGSQGEMNPLKLIRSASASTQDKKNPSATLRVARRRAETLRVRGPDVVDALLKMETFCAGRALSPADAPATIAHRQNRATEVIIAVTP